MITPDDSSKRLRRLLMVGWPALVLVVVLAIAPQIALLPYVPKKGAGDDAGVPPESEDAEVESDE